MFELIIMKAKVSRDRYIRQFISSEKKLLKIKTINISSTLFDKNKAVCSVRNHCIFSGKTRSTKHFFKVSRNFLRDFGLFGKITGFGKKSWLIFALVVELEDTVDSKFTALISLLVQIQSRVMIYKE